MIWAVQGPWLGDVHEVQWPGHYISPETQTHQSPHYQLVRLTVIFGPYLTWPSLCINDARDSVPSGLFSSHFLSEETAWDSGFWYQPRRGLYPMQILCGTLGVRICRAAVRRWHRVNCAPWTCSCGAIQHLVWVGHEMSQNLCVPGVVGTWDQEEGDHWTASGCPQWLQSGKMLIFLYEMPEQPNVEISEIVLHSKR